MRSEYSGYASEQVDSATDLAPIFLAEDSSDDVAILQRALKRAGFINPVKVAADGAEAIEFLERECLDAAEGIPLLMFLDLNLPKRSGLEVLSWIRQQEELRQMPIVILSHSENEPDILGAFRLGANAYWVKPAQIQNLVQMLDSLKQKIGNAERKCALRLCESDAPQPGPSWM